MRFKAVCFDLDGTLLDTLEDLAFCTNKILSKLGYPTHHVNAFRYFIGDGAKMLMTRVLPENVRNETLIEKCRKEFETLYREYWKRRTVPYQGIPELLSALIKLNLKMAVLSNKPQEFTLLSVNQLLCDWNFDLILGQREGVPLKPNPAGMLEICQQLKIPPDHILYLGDTATDMKTAVAAGCFPVGALWGFRGEQELKEGGAQVMIGKPLEVLDLLN